MAGELPPVVAKFIADTLEFIRETEKVRDALAETVAPAREAGDATRKLGEDATWTQEALFGENEQLREVRDSAGEAARDTKQLRDAATETAGALETTTHAARQAADANQKLGRSAEEAAAKLDAMGLMGMSKLKLIAALAAFVAGLAPGVAAAGMGFAAFGALAMPTLSGIFKGYQNITQAQQQYQNAVGAAAKSTALKQLHHDWAQLSPVQANAIHQIMAFKAHFDTLAKAVQPDVLGIFGNGLKLIDRLLPEVSTLAQVAGGKLNDIVAGMAKGANSPGVTKFFTMMQQLASTAIPAIAQLAGAIGHLLVGALEALAPVSTQFINFITLLVRALSGPLITLLRDAAQTVSILLSGLSPIIPVLGQLIQMIVSGVGTAFVPLAKVLTQVAVAAMPALIAVLKALVPILEYAVTPNSPFMLALQMLPGLVHAILIPVQGLANFLSSHPLFGQLAVDALSVYAAFKGLMVVFGLLKGAIAVARGAFAALDVVMSANPVGIVIVAIAALVTAFILLWNHCKWFRDFWIGLWHDIQNITAQVTAWIRGRLAVLAAWWQQNGTQIMNVVRSAWHVISQIIKVALQLLMVAIRTSLITWVAIFRAGWDVISTVVKTAWNVIYTIVSSTIRIISDIIRAVLAVMQGHWSQAWHLMQDAASTGMHQIVTVISDVASGFGHLLWSAGSALIQGLIGGIQSMVGGLFSTLGGIAGKIGGFFGNILGIGSPSRVFIEHGLNIMRGLAYGINSAAPLAYSAISQVAGRLAAGNMNLSAAGIRTYPAGGPPVGGGGGTGGDLIVQIDGRELLRVVGVQAYRYNVRNSGTVTGILRPT